MRYCTIRYHRYPRKRARPADFFGSGPTRTEESRRSSMWFRKLKPHDAVTTDGPTARASSKCSNS